MIRDRAQISCGDELRRDFVRHAHLNGLEHVEVSDDHLTLTVSFLGKAPEGLSTENVLITGGQQVTGIVATEVALCADDNPEIDDCIRVTVDRPGDGSCYTLCLVEAGPHDGPTDVPPPGFDPRYACVEFSFMAGCPSGVDCAVGPACPPETFDEPEISYLAKDYASFRQLLFDRLALIMPSWTETHAPDIGVALVELMSWIGDELSYYQDAVGTEAYLRTARLRTSVRRHVTLVDYRMHDGCNARAWVCIELERGGEPVTLQSGDVAFITAPNITPPLSRAALLRGELGAFPPGSYRVFEPMIAADLVLYPAHSEMYFWSWGNAECCLPAGTTTATLVDAYVQPETDDGADDEGAEAQQSAEPTEKTRALHLAIGDVVIIEEARGPVTGDCADADPSHRQAVRLTAVEQAVDTLFDQPIVNVAWGAHDALRFPACVSSLTQAECELVCPVTVVHGNVVLVDHGATIDVCGEPPEQLTVPIPEAMPGKCEGPMRPGPPRARKLVYEPVLAQSPVTQRGPFPEPTAVARRQARVVAGISDHALADVRALLTQLQADKRLDHDQIGSLIRIFGRSALDDVELTHPVRRPGSVRSDVDQAEAIEALLGIAESLLGPKRRRLETLARRARSGEVLGAAVTAEVTETWGAKYAEGLDPSQPALLGPASGALKQDPRAALPQVTVTLTAGGTEPQAAGAGPATWVPRRTLLASGSNDRDLVGEVDDDGALHLRFGDGTLGERPPAGATLAAGYRIGNGTAGMVGADTIAALVSCTTRFTTVTRVRNPLPAAGASDPEPVAAVKRAVPAKSSRPLVRAITAADYAAIAAADPGLQGSAAELRWTGSWYEADVRLDPTATELLDPCEIDLVTDDLRRVRRIGHDLRVGAAVYVPLDIAMRICVLPDYQRAHVQVAVLNVLSTGMSANGGRGFFDPDNLTFGTSISASRLIGAVAPVAGVESVTVTKLQRLGESDHGELAAGVLKVGPTEIPQLDNDARHPERGVLTLTIGGGR